MEKKVSRMWANSVIKKTCPKVNNRPIGENSPNPVTLEANDLSGR
jgi:hypothetical protein